MAQVLGTIVRVGVDLAHSVLQVHAVDAAGAVVVARKLVRADFLQWCNQLPSGCLIAMEACATSHHLAAKIAALGLEPRLIAPFHVVPFRMSGKSGKNDANDAAAICEAASRPQMRFVTVKTPEQQALLAVHRLREGFIEERTAFTNRTRGLLAEAGVFKALRGASFRAAIPEVAQDAEQISNELLRQALRLAGQHLIEIDGRIAWCDRHIQAHAKACPEVRKAMEVPGIGVLTASAVVATVGDFARFKNGRQFSAWLGLVPRQRSSGGMQRLGRITKRGDRYLRKLLFMGGRSVLFRAKHLDDPLSVWAGQVRQRAGWAKAQVAVANKCARMLWRAQRT